MEIDIRELNRDFPYEIGNDLKYIDTIDRGAFGTVLHVLDIKSNQEIAVKVINKVGESLNYIEKKKEEMSILRKLNHPNIVKFYGFIETNNQFLIKMEYIKYGNLKYWIENKENISEEEASIILRKILSAVEYLHSKQICHRDIKPENIMISKKNDLNSIKIIDFGLSYKNFNNLINNDYSGTYIYMAPELIEKKLYFISVDIWSIGILMFILLNKGKHPFYKKGDNADKIAEIIKKGNIKFYENISPMAKHLVLKLLEPNPSWRYTASQALKHPWITRNFNDVPPQTFNELLVKSNNKEILKNLLYTCLFFNYFRKKENLKFLTNNKKEAFKGDGYENEKNMENEMDYDLFYIKFREKTNSVFSRNKLLINQKHKNIIDKIGYKKNSIGLSNNISTIFQKYKLNNNYFKFSHQNTIITKYSNNIFKKNNSSKSIKGFKLSKNSLRTTDFTQIKKRLHNNIKISISNEKINEESKTKKNSLETSKNIYNYLSSKKLFNNLPKIIKPKKLNLINKYSKDEFSLNNIENSNFIPLILPNIGVITKQRENSKIPGKSPIKKLRILNK